MEGAAEDMYVISAPPQPHPKSVRIRGSIDLTQSPPPLPLPYSLPSPVRPSLRSIPTYIARKCVAYAAAADGRRRQRRRARHRRTAAAAADSAVSKDSTSDRGEIRTWHGIRTEIG